MRNKDRGACKVVKGEEMSGGCAQVLQGEEKIHGCFHEPLTNAIRKC